MDVLKSILVWCTGVLFMVLFFPATFLIWILVLPFDRNRAITHRILVIQSWMVVKMIPIWKVDVTGKEKAARDTTYVIISNHQSILDILLVNSLCYKFKWVSKIENKRVPVLGWYLKMADYITVDRSNKESKEEMLDRSMRFLRKGISVMLFPEGTRSVNREIGFFKRGAFQLAINARVPILPVLIDGSGGVLPKHGLIFSAGHKINIRIFDPVLPESFGTDDPDILSVKFSNFMTEALNELRAGHT